MKGLFSIMVILALFAQAAISLAGDKSKEETRQIQWLTSIDEAMARAKSEKKPVFLDFFNPK